MLSPRLADHGEAAVAVARSIASTPKVRFLPEIDRMKLEAKTPTELHADMLLKAAEIMDAQADFLQVLIDRCKETTITHEEIVARLTAGLQTCRTSSRAMRSAA